MGGERLPLGLEKGRKRIYWPGTVALCEIQKFQKSTLLLIRKLPFVRWVREIPQQIWGDVRLQAMALLALQNAVKAYIISHFDKANMCAINGKCITVMPKDIQLAQWIWDDIVKYLPR